MEHIFLIRKATLLEMFWMQCCVVSRILENPHWRRSLFSNLVRLLLWIHLHTCFNMFVNFETIFFQAALLGCFLRMFNKQVSILLLYLKKKLLSRDVFHSGMKYLYGKYYPGYAEILRWTNEIPPGREKVKNASTSYLNLTANLWRNYRSLLILFIVPSRFLSHPYSHVKSPINAAIRIWNHP